MFDFRYRKIETNVYIEAEWRGGNTLHSCVVINNEYSSYICHGYPKYVKGITLTWNTLSLYNICVSWEAVILNVNFAKEMNLSYLQYGIPNTFIILVQGAIRWSCISDMMLIFVLFYRRVISMSSSQSYIRRHNI